jgi:hypothetical protein
MRLRKEVPWMVRRSTINASFFAAAGSSNYYFHGTFFFSLCALSIALP